MDPPIGKALLLIVGHTPRNPVPAAYLFARSDFLVVPRVRVPLRLRRRPWAWLVDRLRLWTGGDAMRSPDDRRARPWQ
jgi:hypothetical protein